MAGIGQAHEQRGALLAVALESSLLVRLLGLALRLAGLEGGDLSIGSDLVPAVVLEAEEFVQYLLHGIALGLAGGAHQAEYLGDLGRQRLLGAVVDAQHPAVGRVLQHRQVRGGSLVIAEVELEVVHCGLPCSSPRRRSRLQAFAFRWHCTQ